MHFVDQPKFDKSFVTNNLLTASARCTSQSAACALRSWWDRIPPAMMLTQGMEISHHLIFHGNNGDGKDLAIYTVDARDEKGRLVLLCVFADASAVVLRCISEFPDAPEYNRYVVLPVVLRLASTVKFADQSPDVHIKPGRVGKRAIGLYLTTPDKSDQSRITLIAPGHMYIDGIDFECREVITRELIKQAAQWSSTIDTLPALFLPKQGAPSHGKMTSQDLADINLPDDTEIEYTVPAFLTWSNITDEQSQRIRVLSRRMTKWIAAKTGDHFICAIHVTCGMITQKNTPRSIKVDVYINPKNGSNQKIMLDTQQMLSDIAADIFRQELPEIPLDELVAQGIHFHQRRKTWIEPHVFFTPYPYGKERPISAHEKIELFSQFDRYLKEPWHAR